MGLNFNKKIFLFIFFAVFLMSCSKLNSENKKSLWQKLTSSAVSEDPTAAISNVLIGEAENKSSNLIEDSVDSLFSNSKTEVSISGYSEGKPQYEITNVKGLNFNEQNKTQNFIQSSINSNNERQTINLGIGRRYLSDSENYLFGINSFFDIEPEYNHQRASLGLDVKSSSLEFTANNYFGITGWKSGKNNNQERALGGYDMELGTKIPYIPRATFYYKKFKWDLFDATDIEGNTLSLKYAQPSNRGFSLEAGKKSFDGARSDEDFLTLTYSIFFSGDEEIEKNDNEFISDQMFENKSMKKNMLDKVRRHNSIVVQTKFTSSVGGV